MAKKGVPLKIDGTSLDFSTCDQFTSVFSKFLAPSDTLQMFGPAHMEYVTPENDQVRAIWAMEDELIHRQHSTPFEMRTGGYDHEVWQLKDGDGLLKSLRLKRAYRKASQAGTILFRHPSPLIYLF